MWQHGGLALAVVILGALACSSKGAATSPSGGASSSSTAPSSSGATSSGSSSASSASSSSSTSSSGSAIPAPPTKSANPSFTLQQVTTFTGATRPSNMQEYGDEVLSPGGYIADSHLVLTGRALEVRGYVDSASGSVGGVTGAGFDLSDEVQSSGGFDVCLSLSDTDWSGVHLVLISWPADNDWSEGENDFFEGNPAAMDINVHEIGSSPQTNVWQGAWPAALATGAHVVGARWDPSDGYLFYLDGELVGTGAPSAAVQAPTTAHHLAIQMQDIGENSSGTMTATIYWTARYSYP